MTPDRLIPLLAACLLLGACASVPPGARTEHAVPPETYPDLFDAARETLAEHRFTLDRVDAARGVITTAPKRTTGLASLWDREQTTLAQNFEDLAHQHERVARVTFEPADNPTRVGVEVVVQRVRRPHWRIETDAIRFSGYATDPIARRAGVPPEFREPIAEDRALAARLMHRILERAGLDPDTPEPAPQPAPAHAGPS